MYVVVENCISERKSFTEDLYVMNYNRGVVNYPILILIPLTVLMWTQRDVRTDNLLVTNPILVRIEPDTFFSRNSFVNHRFKRI